MENKKFRVLLLRGLLGGVIGGFLACTSAIFLLQVDRYSTTWNDWILVCFVLQGLPLGLVVGGLAGLSIWLIHRQTKLELGHIGRVATGTAVAILVAIVLHLGSDPMGYMPTPWPTILRNLLVFGVPTGGTAGLIVGSQSLMRIRADNGRDPRWEL